MAPRKDPEKVPEIPYSGALKKLLEPILNANFPCTDDDVNVGKKYWIQRKIATPRLWYIELHKLPRDVGFAFRVVVNAALPPAAEPAFASISSVLVADVKVNGENLILWVQNSSGSVANFIFNEREDKFQARLYTAALAIHDEAVKEVWEQPLLDSQDFKDLNGNSRNIAKVLKSVLSDMNSVNALYGTRASKGEGNRARKRVSTPAAPSREKSNKGKGKLVEEGADAAIHAVAATAAAAASPENDAEDESSAYNEDVSPQSDEDIPGAQLPTGGIVPSSDVVEIETPVAKRKPRARSSRKNAVADHPEIATLVQSPERRRVLEEEFRAASISASGEVSPAPKKKRGGVLQHPRKTADGREIDVEDRTEELKQFKERTKPIFPFGQGFRRHISIDKMVVAPPEYKYRPFHDSLVKTLLDIMLTAIHPHKQTLTLMPITDVRPTSFDDVKNGLFHIINGQHSWAAAKLLIENPLVSEDEKEKWKQWRCDFVWTSDLVLLSDFSRRANNQNQHQWNSPEYLLHIQYARDLWITYGRPQPRAGVKLTTTERKNWKDFQLKAAETLNSMLEKNAAKSSNDYQGEFKIICADDEVFNATMKAFKWYESGDLLNPDTGKKWKEEAQTLENKEWTRKYTVAYTFKCVRSLGRESLLELIQKITAGLTERGDYLPERSYPKVFLGGNKPKSKKVSTLKDWTDRKKAKNAVVRWLSRRTDQQLWGGEDVNSSEWKEFKEQVGFTSAHMDELIRRATRAYLAKFMKVSDNPKREQVPPSDAFLSEMQRILSTQAVVDPELGPVLAWYQNDGKLSEYARERQPNEDDVPGIPGWFSNDWVQVYPTQFSFAGGIMDLRAVDKFMEDDEVIHRIPTAAPYISFLSSFRDILTATSYWMVIAWANKSEQVVDAFKEYFPAWHASESRYVPAAAEKFFFSSSTLKVGNGIIIYKLSKKGLAPLICKKQVASDESSRKFGEVREYGLYDHELRMETYLNYVSEISAARVHATGAEDIMCITAGRKAMIAAVMCTMRPVAVVVYNKPSGPDYLQAHKLGCKLTNFQHLFDSSLRTEDAVHSDDWLLTAQESSESEDEPVQREIRMKSQGDVRHVLFDEAEELHEDSEEATDASSDEEERGDDTGEQEHSTRMVDSRGGCTSMCPPVSAPAPSSLAKFNTFLMVISSPAEQIYNKSTFSAFSPDLEQLLRNKEVPGMSQRTSSFLGDSGLGVPTTSTEDCIADVGMECSTPPVVNSPAEVEPMELDVQAEIGRVLVAAEGDTAEGARTCGLLTEVHRVAKDEPMDETPSSHAMESNKDDPIIIDSDEEDHILTSVRNENPSDSESDLSDLPVDVPANSEEAKVSQQRALRIQLKAISKKKLSLNRATLRKNRELEFEVRKLVLELAKEREFREKAAEHFRSQIVDNTLPVTSNCPSPSVGRSHQATTSIASAPAMSMSEAGAEIEVPGMQDVREDCVPGTQESTLARQSIPPVKNANATQGVKASADKHQLTSKHGLQSIQEKFKCPRKYISDCESVSPRYSDCFKLQKNRLVRRFRVEIEDDDEVTSVVRE